MTAVAYTTLVMGQPVVGQPVVGQPVFEPVNYVIKPLFVAQGIRPVDTVPDILLY